MELMLENDTRVPTVDIRPRRGLFHLDLAALWHNRELLCFLIWRDILTRYKQTAIGAAWVILQPLITMMIFTVIFGTLARFPSDGVAYPVFAFTGLLPWAYFSQALSRTSASVVSSSNLVTKIYFPRLLIPLAAAISPVVDLLISFVVLLFLMGWYRITPGWGLLALPLLIFLVILATLAVGLWSAALNVRYRDVGSIMPFVIQIWMYASPIAYPVSMVPAKWQALYGLNPLVGVIEGFRWALLGKPFPPLSVMGTSTAMILVLFFGGLIYFKWSEQSFADII